MHVVSILNTPVKQKSRPRIRRNRICRQPQLQQRVFPVWKPARFPQQFPCGRDSLRLLRFGHWLCGNGCCGAGTMPARKVRVFAV